MSRNETSLRDIVVENLGPLYGKDKAAAEAFSGNIGVDRKKDALALEVLEDLNWDYFYQPAVRGASERCVDERPGVSFVKSMDRPAGPQSAGGSMPYAAIHGIVRGTSGNLQHDLRVLAGDYKQSGMPYDLGGHTANGHEFDGCGAMKGFVPMVGRFSNPVVEPYIRTATRLLMSPEKFDSHAYDKGVAGFRYLFDNMEEYLGAEGYHKQAIDFIRHNSRNGIEAVEDQSGDHLALTVMDNQVEGTTLDRDMLAAMPNKAGRVIEAFNFDGWYPDERGIYLYGGGSEMQSLATTMTVAYNVAALTVLTNGSIDLRVRREAA